MLVATNPTVVYVSGGDALEDQQLAETLDSLSTQAKADALGEVQTKTFRRQGDLRFAVYEHLRRVAGAMKPLNAANAKGGGLEFMLREWRTITPEVLVASDCVTLVQRVIGASADGGRKEGISYFEEHAKALGDLQALSWIGLCSREDSQSLAQKSPSLEEDINQYVLSECMFAEAPERFGEYAGPLIRDQANPWRAYRALATMAIAHARNGTTNPLAADWTVMWMRFELARLQGDAEHASKVDLLGLTTKILAGTLVDRVLFDHAGKLLEDALKKGKSATEIEQISEIGVRAGYRALAADLMTRGLKIRSQAWSTAEGVMATIRENVDARRVSTRSTDELGLEPLVNLVAAPLVELGDLPALTSVFEQTTAIAGDDETRAELESWFGATLVHLNQEHLLLKHIGNEERPWEEVLPSSLKGRLWTERANALRAVGNVHETLKWRQRVVPLYEGAQASRNYRTAVRLLVIAYREAGSPDHARDILRPMLEDKAALDRIDMLDTNAANLVALGEIEGAAAALDEAIELSVGPDAGRRQHFISARAGLYGNKAIDDKLEESLLASSKAGWMKPVTLLHECVAWMNLRVRGRDLSNAGEERSVEATSLMASKLKTDVEFFPPSTRESAYRVLAGTAEILKLPDVGDYWSAAADAADALGVTPHPTVVLALAEIDYRAGRIEEARAICATLPAAMTRGIEGLLKIDAALDALVPLSGRFRSLTEYLLEQGFGHDAAIINEFRRDPLRRSTLPRFSDEEIEDFITGKSIQRVFTGGGLAVLEFLEGRGGALAAMLSWSAEGVVRSVLLEWPPTDLEELRDRLVNRLQVWVRGRAGSPFDVEGWSGFRDWVRKYLIDTLRNSGHLVVIEHELLAGLPFHVAVAPELSCSYTSSWLQLMRHGSAVFEPHAVGYAAVPAYSDDGRVGEAMRSAATQCRGIAEQTGLSYDEKIGSTCDRTGFTQLLAASDVAMVACHGFVDEQRHEVAWVLAHEGGLPSRTGALVRGEEKQITHFGWRDIQHLVRTPQLVISAACSSGRALMVGLGDRIGLFSSLAAKGTRTFIAPGWDVDADLVLPIATRVLELCVEGQSAAKAVRTACNEAGQRLPDWIAWSLTIEGASQ